MKTTRIIAFMLIGLPMLASAQIVNTPFTYQGELLSSGSPANGTYDITFDAFLQSSGGTSILFLGPDEHLGVTITNGLFTVNDVDFGNLAFATGADVWIEIGIRPSTGGSYTILPERQKITSSPYAIKADFANTASSADNLQIFGASANDVLVYDGSNWKSGGNKIRVSSVGVSVGTTSIPPTDGLRVGGDTNLDGNITQGLSKTGLPKYLVYARCNDGSNAISGNDLTGNNGNFSITSTATAGYCFITFPASISGKYWIASAVNNDGAQASCDIRADTTQLACQRVDRQGNYQWGDFNIVVF